MLVENSPTSIRLTKNNRFSEFLPVPDEFHDESLGLSGDRRYTIRKPFTVEGMAVFENCPMEITVRPSGIHAPHFISPGQDLTLKAEYAVKGEHNIQLKELKLIEHVLSMLLALNLDLDFELTQNGFPLFPYTNRVFLEKIRGNLKEGEPARYFTVKDRIMLTWPGGGYMILEPDEGEHKLIVDHQISYPGNTPGNQRIKAEMEPTFATFINECRTNNFSPPEKSAGLYEKAKRGEIKDYPITAENVLFADQDRFYNPREKYYYKNIYYEFILHELLDMTAFLKFLEVQHKAKFVGVLTTYLYDHHKQIEAAQLLTSQEFLDKKGIAYD